jgi:hypothetical protein
MGPPARSAQGRWGRVRAGMELARAYAKCLPRGERAAPASRAEAGGDRLRQGNRGADQPPPARRTGANRQAGDFARRLEVCRGRLRP